MSGRLLNAYHHTPGVLRAAGCWPIAEDDARQLDGVACDAMAA